MERLLLPLYSFIVKVVRRNGSTFKCSTRVKKKLFGNAIPNAQWILSLLLLQSVVDYANKKGIRKSGESTFNRLELLIEDTPAWAQYISVVK